jgi:hypothetical protein
MSPHVGLWLAASIVALMPIAWVYAWLMLFARVGPLILLFSIVYGGCCARAAFLTAGLGKARNSKRMAWIGAGIGIIGWYWQWVAWLSLASTQPSLATLLNHVSPTVIDLAASPRSMYVLAMQIRDAMLVDENGTSLVKSPGFAWILEIVYGAAVSAAFAWSRARRPFCEVGDNWGEVLALPRRHALITDCEDFIKQMEVDARDALDSLTSFPSTEQGFSTIAVTICRPSKQAFVTVKNIAIAVKDGVKKEKESIVIENLSIKIDLADDLIRQSATGGNLRSAPAVEDDLPELQPAIDNLEAGNYADVLTSVAPYLESDRERISKDAIRLAALANSRLNQWDLALGHWRNLFDREATAHNALQVATASVMAGNVVQGEQWMSTAVTLNKTTGDVPSLLIQTNFITALKNSGNFERALPYLQNLKEIYEQLHITDPTFLYLRGVPHFSTFLENSREVVVNVLSISEATRWYESMLPNIDSSGQEELSSWIKNGMPELPQPIA